jgi:uncharacterized protein (TIGR02172 family)
MINKMNKIAEGFTSEIFEINDNLILKLYKPSFENIAKIEFEKMQYIQTLNLNIPKVFEIKTIENSFGYTMQKVNGKNLAIILDNNIINFDDYIKDFAKFQFLIHNSKCNSILFDDLIPNIIKRVGNNKNILDKNKRKLIKYLENNKNDDLCHNDFHFNNIIIDNNQFYIIDWNGSGYGNFLLDIAKTCILFEYLPANIAFNKKLQGMKNKIINKYLNEYNKLKKIDKNELLKYKLIRIAELTSLNIPNIKEMLKYFNKNFVIFED